MKLWKRKWVIDTFSKYKEILVFGLGFFYVYI